MSRSVWALRLLAAVFGASLVVLPHSILADDHHDRKSKHDSREQKTKGTGPAGWINNPAYQENCGSCHMAYPPGLLPARSWSKILAGLADHHGEAVELDPAVGLDLAAYLKNNAADVAGGKRSRKIVSSLGSATPIRVTEVPYLARKHSDDDLPADAFTRPSVGSRSNCRACHPGAEQGDFDDDRVRIPAP